MPNRLAQETSPYLLQHANNPVDWHPWGDEALARARREDRPIFLSIGYSACHWCHVMEHESFENPAIAKLLNDSFICIKVDREERPDLDQVYMTAVQMISGRGGWPMSMFLTPELKPFYGGTYWPPTARMGMPGFDQVIAAVLDAWKNRRAELDEQAGQLTARLAELGRLENAAVVELPKDGLHDAAAALERVFDHTYGGFGGAPKFPHPMDIRVLLRYWRRQPQEAVLKMVSLTLDKMAAGGVYDHLGGGFHRYSVDERWLVPHFEKMLYDNALLAACYVEAYQATGRDDYARVARETLEYVLREMTAADGGFYSTQDADSEGEEGKFYVWSVDEITDILGAQAARTFCYVYDVTDGGNFEGHNILNLPKTLEQCAKLQNRPLEDLVRELHAAREKLLAVRSRRIWPGLDDKQLVSWNALMIDALAQAAGPLDEPKFLAAATAAADFILHHLRRPDGRLLHSWRLGQARFDAYLDDYAALANALVSLYEASFDGRWIDEATRLADALLTHFADNQAGGFFYTAHDHETLIARQKDAMDSSVPSGNALAATALLRLAKLCGRADYRTAAEGTLRAFGRLIENSPSGAGQMLVALDFYDGPTPELALAGEADSAEMQAVLRDLRRRYVPNRVLAATATDGQAGAASPLRDLLAGKRSMGGEPTLYVCENFQCQAPVTGAKAIAQALDKLAPR